MSSNTNMSLEGIEQPIFSWQTPKSLGESQDERTHPHLPSCSQTAHPVLSLPGHPRASHTQQCRLQLAQWALPHTTGTRGHGDTQPQACLGLCHVSETGGGGGGGRVWGGLPGRAPGAGQGGGPAAVLGPSPLPAPGDCPLSVSLLCTGFVLSQGFLFKFKVFYKYSHCKSKSNSP